MLTPNDLGIRVEEERGPDQSIARLSTARTAFVGRTLRGPVNRPVLLRSFAEFQHDFGGLWQPSPLGYAVEQFFDNGGREALIVRVINGARCATLTLKAGGSGLGLRAVRPGTREFLRASVDYDNVLPSETDVFNLTIQRVRTHGTAQVEDQEIFRRVSILSAAENYVVDALSGSELVRVVGERPAQRPNQTFDPSSGLATGYVNSNADGDDGAPLSDYDLIGSEVDRTGIFSLADAEYFNFLCLPPLSRDQDVGPSALLVGTRYCQERRALLIVDPPSAWHTADDALRGIRDWDLSNENALMYFPRLLAHDKLRGHFESFAPCGAVAGMLARCDEVFPVWTAARHEEAVLRPGYRPSCLVSEERRMKLALLGVNTLQAVRTAARIGVRPRTLAAGNAGSADWQQLASRRLALFIINSVERGTRWIAMRAAVDMVEAAAIAEAATAQVRVFFEQLHEEGAFGALPMPDAFFVSCERRAHASDTEAAAPEFQLVIGFAALRGPGFHAFRITRSQSSSKVQAVSLDRLNRAHYSPAELEWVDSIAHQLRP